jgi:endonuclease YncB( thermonuclease family)
MYALREPNVLLSIARLLLAIIAVALSVTAQAKTIHGRVVRVSDGDTITVLDATATRHKIRLSGIDAPEKRQAFGRVSKRNLARLVFYKQVSVEYDKRDRHGRIVGKVLLGGSDICIRQIEDGFAWHFKKYEDEQRAIDRVRYSRAESEARAARIDLWGDAEPLPPWEFRKHGAAYRLRVSSSSVAPMNSIIAIHPYKHQGMGCSTTRKLAFNASRSSPALTTSSSAWCATTSCRSCRDATTRTPRGNRSSTLGMEGWLCSALLKYFGSPPPKIYAQFRAKAG